MKRNESISFLEGEQTVNGKKKSVYTNSFKILVNDTERGLDSDKNINKNLNLGVKNSNKKTCSYNS